MSVPHAPRLSVSLLSVGHCRHCERVTLSGGSLHPVSFPSICALIVHPQEGAFLYDTGYADRFFSSTNPFPERVYRWLTPVNLPAEERLGAQLSALGIWLEDIRACLISHFHADHIAGLRDLKNARFIALRADVEKLDTGKRLCSLMNGFLPALLPEDFSRRLSHADTMPRQHMGLAWAGLGDGFDLLGDGSLLAVPLPGHAPGQMGLRFRDELDREVLLCADACWSRAAWQELRYPSSLVRPVTHNWALYRQTLNRLHELGTRHPELFIVPSHCATSLSLYRSGKSAHEVSGL